MKKEVENDQEEESKDQNKTNTDSEKQQNTTSSTQNSALNRIRAIQEKDWKEWKGVGVSAFGRPGTASIIKRRPSLRITQHEINYDKRNSDLFYVLTKMREIDSDNGVSLINKSTINNYQTCKSYNASARPYLDTLLFKPVKENQLLNTAPPALSYSKSYNMEHCELLYKLLKCDAKLCRSILEAGGFRHTESHDWNILWMTSSGKPYIYEGLNEYQKVNHFPCSYEITRKDKLCQNYVKMQELHGYKEFEKVPDTYCLPDEFSDFYVHYNELKAESPYKNIWIIKPNASSQGKGIYITDDIHDIDQDESCIVSRYIHNPLLINSHKFDLRIYVLVAGFEPLRIYIYKEGLTRFASEPYSSGHKFNAYSHLTNYSLNKKNTNFVHNQTLDQDDYGFKWSLTALCKHLEEIGIDMNLLWTKIHDIIIKTIICAEDKIYNATRKNCGYRTNCFELLGFDIIIDSELKPWLLEVNMSPSLSTDSPLDMKLKSCLISDTFNLIGIKKFDRRKESMNKAKNRMKGLYARGKSLNTRYTYNFSYQNGKPSTITETAHSTRSFLNTITSQQLSQELVRYLEADPSLRGNKELIKKLVPLKYKEILRECIDEYQRKGNFIRIYPSKGSDSYDKFFKGYRPYNNFLYKCLFTEELIPEVIEEPYTIPKTMSTANQIINGLSEMNSTRNDTGMPDPENEANKSKKRPQTVNPSSTKVTKQPEQETEENEKKDAPQKILITGDDVLIEYVNRLVVSLKKTVNDQQSDIEKIIELFIGYYVWHTPDLK